MKKTFYTLLVGLTCALTTKAQTNDTTAVAPTDTNSAPVVAPADTNVTTAPVASDAAPVVDTNTVVTAAVGIPQIKFSDVPITTAIENLARLAGINYMLDPKIGYGLADANGQIKVEPTLSIRWENITAENALLALLDNYNLQLIHDKKTGIDRITLKDPTAPPPLFTKVIQLKYAGVSNLLDAAQSVLTDKRSKVLTDARSSQLVIVATDPEQQAVETLVAQLDKPTRQVLIETRLVEISSNPRTQKGVDWSGTLQAQQITFGNGNSSGAFTTTFPGAGGVNGQNQPVSGGSGGSSTVGSVVNQVGNGGFSWNTQSGTTPGIGFLNASGMSAVLSFLNSSADAQIMSTPRIVTLDNEVAHLSVTRGYPIFNVSGGSANSAGGSSVNYSNVGTMIDVTPRISANDYIWLKVIPTVSSFFGNFSQTTAGGTSTAGNPQGTQVLTAPVFDTRTLMTQVLIPNSNTLVLGGLVQDNPKGTYTKVPLLGDIPALGFMFRSEDKELNKDNLLIFITPTIVKDNDFQTSKSGDFLNSKPISLKQTMNPSKSWDGAQPVGNWTDPVTADTK
jgi:type II secretory pathway component GspD/PulD (secretin)